MNVAERAVTPAENNAALMEMTDWRRAENELGAQACTVISVLHQRSPRGPRGSHRVNLREEASFPRKRHDHTLDTIFQGAT